MTLKLKSVAGILAISLVAFASCKKKSDNSVKSKLTGKWKTTKDGYDANNNGTMDASEVYTVTDSTATLVTFNSDGTATSKDFVSGTNSTSFTWKLINSDKDIVITESGLSDTAHIESLTSTDLEISDKGTDNMGTTVKTWAFFHKQ